MGFIVIVLALSESATTTSRLVPPLNFTKSLALSATILLPAVSPPAALSVKNSTNRFLLFTFVFNALIVAAMLESRTSELRLVNAPISESSSLIDATTVDFISSG